jgi:hypothetical protein
MKLAIQDVIDQVLIERCGSEIASLIDKYRYAATGTDLENGYTFALQCNGGNGEHPETILDIEARWPLPAGRHETRQYDHLRDAMDDPRAEDILIEEILTFTKIDGEWWAL